MEASVYQFNVFVYSLILGVILGMLYDVFRIVRIIFKPKEFGVFIQDMVYFILSAFLTFIFMIGFNDGEIRFYVLIGEGIGFCVYHLTVGRFFVLCMRYLVEFIIKILNIVKGWIYKFIMVLKRRSVFLTIKLKNIKNVFNFKKKIK
jgi:spore cortex biosynthesis protein YabQ